MRILLITATAFVSMGASAASLDLTRIPPSINSTVPPNILVSLDDSGSMAWGYMPDNRSSIGNTCTYYDPSLNRQYYNPSAVYLPPLRPDGTSYPNASFNRAPFDGFNPGFGSVDLHTEYRVSHDHRGYANYSGGWRTTPGNSTSRTFPAGVEARNNNNRYHSPTAFYCNGSNVVLLRDQTAAARQNFANWFAYYRIRSLSARSALATSIAQLDQSTRVAWQNFNDGTYNLPGSTQIKPLARPNADGTVDPTWRNDFHTWLIRPAFDGNTPMPTAFRRAGRFFSRGASGDTITNATNPYWDEGFGRELACRQNYQVMVTDGYWNVAVSDTDIGNYDREGRVLEDGHTLSGPAAMVYYNVNDGGTRPPNLADMAMYYWGRDLRPDLPNIVPAYYGDRSTGVTGGSVEDQIWFNPANDPGDWQRMVNFMVTFGAGASLPYASNTLTRLRTGDLSWPAVSSGANTTIDDAWHAAVNSRGEFLSADDPEELVNSLVSIMDNVSRRQGVVGTAGSTNYHRSDSAIFLASYDTGTWGGDLMRYGITDEGETDVLNPQWTSSAGAQLAVRSPTDRRIISNRASSGAAQQVDFQYSSLSPDQQAALNRNPVTNVVDSLGSQRVAWLRGDRTQEQTNGGVLRSRSAILGPILDSKPVYVEAPQFGYRARAGFPEGGVKYEEFRHGLRNREPVVYVGANDGMLHAFTAGKAPNVAAGGRELWAFIPSRVIPNLARMTVPEYQFVPFVNNTPAIHDVYFNDAWHTVLVGTLGLGGQGVYAIDITDPASPSVLWEFTDESHAHLGYTYGQPNIWRLHDGRWVAVISSGYNSEAQFDYATRGLPNERPDSHFVPDGDSDGRIFMIDVQTGSLVASIAVPGSRGLASPQLADVDLDYKLDFIAVGDLNGSVYRIDTTEDDFGAVTRIFSGTPERPITTMPTIFQVPGSTHTTIVVGTGKYLEDVDREINIPQQAIYGLSECGVSCSKYGTGIMIEHQMTLGGNGYFTMDVTTIPRPEDAERTQGWVISLGNPAHDVLAGERIIKNGLGVFDANMVVLESFIPSRDPCAPAGTGALYVLNAHTGGFVFPGDLNENEYDPGNIPVIGTNPANVGRLFGDRPVPQPFINPGTGEMSISGETIRGLPVRRRSGWREIEL